jgi:phosphatidylinositol glycan class V
MVLRVDPKHLWMGPKGILVGSLNPFTPPALTIWVRGVGIFRYWTISNLPLFLLAAPMLYILLNSGVWAWNGDIRHRDSDPAQIQGGGGVARPHISSVDLQSNVAPVIAFRYAVPQIILAVLAFTTYHVQVITRISSGYPVWYWWLASLILEDCNTTYMGMNLNPAKMITIWMVIYAVVQGGLFADFLPPA